MRRAWQNDTQGTGWPARKARASEASSARGGAAVDQAEEAIDPGGRVAERRDVGPAGQRLRGGADERVVHQEEGLGRHGRLVAAGAGALGSGKSNVR